MPRSVPARPPHVPLTDGVVTLRTRRESDLASIVAASHDPETDRWLDDDPLVPIADDVAARAAMARVEDSWQSGRAAPLVVADAVTDEPVGLVNLQFRDDRVATVAYSVFPEHRGRGVAPRAVRLVTPWARDSLGVEELLLEAHDGNAASIRVAEKCGFTQVDESDGDRRAGPDQAQARLPARRLEQLALRRVDPGRHPGGDRVVRRPPRLLAGEDDVVAGALDRDVGDVRAVGRGPAPDLADVEHDVGAVDVLAHLLGQGRAAGGEDQHGAAERQAAVQPGVALPDRAQPAGVDGERLDRLPQQVEVPLAVVVAVQAARVEPGDVALDLALRLAEPELLEDRRAHDAHHRAALQVEPGGVHHRADQLGGASVVGPQPDDQPAGRVGRDHDLGVPVALGDPLPRRVDLGVVVAQVGDVVGGLVGAQGAAVLAQVERVEVVAALGPPVGVPGLEEVVGEAVQVQHRLGGRPGRGPAHERRDDLALVVRRQRDGLGEVGLSQDVCDRLHVGIRGHGAIFSALRRKGTQTFIGTSLDREGPTRQGPHGPGRQPAFPAAPTRGRMMKKIVALFTLLVVLTACGGGGRPSSDDIAKALKDKGNPAGAAFGSSGASDDAIDCIAKALHDSDLSDDALQAIVDGDEDAGAKKGDAEALSDPDFTADVTKCITG